VMTEDRGPGRDAEAVAAVLSEPALLVALCAAIRPGAGGALAVLAGS
jgi:hypothetical protein